MIAHKIAILLLLFQARLILSTNTLREEDFYLVHTTLSTQIYTSALNEVSKAIKRARKDRKYEGSKWSNLVFEDLEETLAVIRESLSSLITPSFSTTSYLKKEAETTEPESFDTKKYDQQIGLDRGEAFHYVYSGDHIDYHKGLLSAMDRCTDAFSTTFVHGKCDLRELCDRKLMRM